MGDLNQGDTVLRPFTGRGMNKGIGKATPWKKSKELTFPPRLEILQTTQDSHFPNTAATAVMIIFPGLRDESMRG